MELEGVDANGLPSRTKGQKRDLVTLLEHDNHGAVWFSSNDRGFKRALLDGKETRVKGLVRLLEKTFWPDYEYLPSKYKNARALIRSRWEGMQRGQLVHRQIEMYVNRGREQVEKRYGEMHPFARTAVAAMREWKWTPVLAEMTVHDSETDVATKVDLICLDRNEDMVLVEWKCGMENYLFRGTNVMRGPLKGVYSNCPLHQAFVQLMFTKMFVEKNYGVRPRHSYVVQIHSDGIAPYSLPKDMEKLQERCYQRFVAHVIEKNQRKKNNGFRGSVM